MSGLARVCKMYGGMKIVKDGKTTKMKWDYAKDKAVDETEMPEGSDRWKESERAKWTKVYNSTE